MTNPIPVGTGVSADHMDNIDTSIVPNNETVLPAVAAEIPAEDTPAAE